VLGIAVSRTVAAEDLTQDALSELDAGLQSGAYEAIHAVVVQQHGRIVREWYLDGEDETIGTPLGHVRFTPETLHDIRSVTKSVVSLLFGIAAAEHEALDLDTPVVEYFPEYRADPRLTGPTVAGIRLRHILSMTSGWRWDEHTYAYDDPRNSEIAMDIAPDPTLYALTQDILAPPGSRWTYSGGDVALVGAIISKVTGRPLEDFAPERLFEPMGIAFEWSKNRGVPRAASGLRLTPRDMAKLGRLVLNEGAWQGRQLIPRDWIESATSAKIDISTEEFPDRAYGYLWWLGTAEPATIGGFGNGGQRIWIVPEHDVVVATTAGAYDRPDQGAAPQAVFHAVLRALSEGSPGLTAAASDDGP